VLVTIPAEKNRLGSKPEFDRVVATRRARAPVDVWLVDANHVDEVSMQNRSSHATVLIKANGLTVVVRCDQPEPGGILIRNSFTAPSRAVPTPLFSSRLLRVTTSHSSVIR
jgi:hypothetical protein